VFLYSGPLMRRLGPSRVFHASLGAMCLRLAWYGSFYHLTGLPWASLVAEPLNGLTFALGKSSMYKTYTYALYVMKRKKEKKNLIELEVWRGYCSVSSRLNFCYHGVQLLQ
jgi:hypothetical protein